MSKTVTLKKKEDRRITDGHLWAFSNEIAKLEGELQAGDIVHLNNHKNEFLGIGFYNPHSLIAVRLLSRKDEEINFHFFRRRIESSLALRRMVYPSAETFRLINGEADFLPGLIVDKYNDHLSIQISSSGMEKRLTLLCDVLESLFHPHGIIERNESPVRTLEGLERRKGILRGTLAPVTISEHGIKYTIDLLEGQKTGFFLDQRENRKAIRRYAKGARVLDCFCNDGGFALNAAYAEAKNVVAIDVSDLAVHHATSNASLNKLQNVTFVMVDAFKFLEQAVKEKQTFDCINLDPPSFAKGKKDVVTAKKGYKELHSLALRLLPPGGILATASCSHHIYEDVFLEIINNCARLAGRNLSLLEWRGAAPDHPVLPAMPETRYLKFGIFRVD